MQYPKMIIFDYGHTLLYEPGVGSCQRKCRIIEVCR